MYPSTSQLPIHQPSSSQSYGLLPQKGKVETPYKVVGSGVCENAECM